MNAFKAGDKVWVGFWSAGEFRRLWSGVVTGIKPKSIHVSDGYLIHRCDPKNLELIRPDLNEKLK